jgi:hypothetical protein
MSLNISMPSSETLKAWAERADHAWGVMQGILAPYDATVARWVSPWVDNLPPMADGILTLMATPVVLVSGLVVFTLFDAFGTLLQRITFSYHARRPMAPVYFQAYTALQQAIPSRSVLPATRLIDILGMKSGSRYQRGKHWYRLATHKVDAVICDPETLAPQGVALWQPTGQSGRHERKRQRRIKRLCKKAHLSTWHVGVNSKGAVTLSDTMRRDLRLASVDQSQPATPSAAEKTPGENTDVIPGSRRNEPTLSDDLSASPATVTEHEKTTHEQRETRLATQESMKIIEDIAGEATNQKNPSNRGVRS